LRREIDRRLDYVAQIRHEPAITSLEEVDHQTSLLKTGLRIAAIEEIQLQISNSSTSVILSLPVSLYSLSSPCCLFHSSSSQSLFSFSQRAIRKFDIISEILSTSLPAYRRLSSGRRVATSGPSCSA
jgi:hypothetical protein